MKPGDACLAIAGSSSKPSTQNKTLGRDEQDNQGNPIDEQYSLWIDGIDGVIFAPKKHQTKEEVYYCIE